MKKLICIFLIVGCLASSLFASTTNAVTSTLTLQLNHLTYTPLYPVIIQDELPYLSIKDLSAMTYSPYTEDASDFGINLQNTKLTFNKKDLGSKTSGVNFQMTNRPFLNDEGILYLPLTLLDQFKYPYTFSKETGVLSMEPLPPYSTATDTYNTHLYLPISVNNFDTLLNPILRNEEINTLIASCKRSNSYFSFISINNKKEVFSGIYNSLLPRNFSYNVYFRKLNLTEDEPMLGDLTSLPLSYRVVDNSLEVSLGDEKIPYNCLWATYNPALSGVNLDVNKSLDAMLMRVIYEYYRNTYGLKDDYHVTPITQIKRDRSDTLSYLIYTATDATTPHYKVTIYQQCTSKTVSYYVDLAKL